MNRTSLKQSAKAQLQNRWAWSAIFILVYTIIVSLFAGVVKAFMFGGVATMSAVDPSEDFAGSMALNLVGTMFLAALVFNLLQGMFRIGVDITFLKIADENYDSNIFHGIFHAFTHHRFYANFISYLLVNIFTALWSILLIIPGIIKSYSYAMTYYIVEDMVQKGQTISTTEAINKSRQLMNGHKFELFVLDLSFIGWGILASIPLGIGWFWLLPYIATTKANFYRKLLEND